MKKLLRTLDEIRAAGRAVVADWPPLTDEALERLAVILAPIGDQHVARRPPEA